MQNLGEEFMSENTSAQEFQRTVAAKRIQRVWRLEFRNALSQGFALECLKPDVGVRSAYVKSVR